MVASLLQLVLPAILVSMEQVKQNRHFTDLRKKCGEGNGNPLQYSCLENPMDGGVWQAAVHGVAQSRTRLSDFTFTFHFHALEKEMATHSSVLAWRIPGGAWWAAVHGIAQGRTRLKRLSSSSSSKEKVKIPVSKTGPHSLFSWSEWVPVSYRDQQLLILSQ